MPPTYHDKQFIAVAHCLSQKSLCKLKEYNDWNGSLAKTFKRHWQVQIELFKALSIIFWSVTAQKCDKTFLHCLLTIYISAFKTDYSAVAQWQHSYTPNNLELV